jgi:outer membrane protein assembly factor BamD (BamD/ComL family)
MSLNAYIMTVLAIAGSYWVVVHKVNLDDPLKHTHQYKDKGWSAHANYYIGLAYYQRSDYPRAQAAFEQLLADHASTSTNTYRAKGLVYLSDAANQGNDFSTAKYASQLYVDEFPEGKDIDRMKKKLEYLKYKYGP